MKRTASPLLVVLQAILIIGMVPLLPPTDGAPSVSISSPPDGSISTSRTVNLTGTALGSESQWLQTSTADFSASGRDQLSVDNNGTVSLNRTRTIMYDDFNDNVLDPDRWNWSYNPDLSIAETGGQLNINGSSGYCWSETYIESARNVPTSASAELKSRSGQNYELIFYLYDDSWNNAYFGIYSSSYYYNGSNGTNGTNGTSGYWYNYTRLYWGYNWWGSQDDYTISLPSNSTLNFKIAATANSTAFYLNNVLKGTAYTSMESMSIRIEARCFDYDSWLDAWWDNVRAGDYYADSGNLTSSVLDTATDGPVLSSVRWNATVPNGTGVSVHVRSSDSWDMSSPTAWAAVTNGQKAGFPATKQYIQYIATLTSPDGWNTPAFKDIELTYAKPVAKVEVSFDQNATWKAAAGTSPWQISLELPENTVYIWVKATDAAGDKAVTSIRVDIDTTPPVGRVLIDNDAPFTTDHSVTLALNATDRYGVVSMMASEDAAFAGATWADYATSLGFRLSSGDGTKTVFVKYRDSNGWESAACNDSILLDTQPPLGGVLIDGGAGYTRNATVTLTFNATDPSGVASMLVSNTLDFAGAQWMDYAQSLRWGLIAGSGERSVYVKFRDAGAHVSVSADDSIIADLLAPTVALSIDGGAAFTRYRNVTVGLAPTENIQTVSMQVREGDGSFPAELAWPPYQPSVQLVLSAADGPKTVSARLLDAAGNIGPSATGWILLDTAAPVTKLAGFPAVSYRASLNISWDATDAGIGVAWYDVQYKTGDSPWTDWVVRANTTSAVFTGQDGKTYSFRARSQDRAGNLEEFPATTEVSVTVQLSEAALIIQNPAQKATVGGKARISGQVQPDAEGRAPMQVLVRVDDGPWQLAEGTLNWSLYLDTRNLADGTHVIRVKSFDGSQYSAETERTVTVKNAGAAGAFDPVPVLAVGLIIAVVAIVAMAFVNRRKPVPVAQPVQ
jgi:hypothetical protein